MIKSNFSFDPRADKADFVHACSHVNDKYVPAMSLDSPSREGDPQTEYTTGTDTAYSQTMSIAQG